LQKKLKIKAKLKEYGLEDGTILDNSIKNIECLKIVYNFKLDTVNGESASTVDQVYSSHIVAVDANPNLGQSTTKGHTVSVC
jgi:hypothetical protein